MNKKVLVTGAGGFIGKYLSKKLLEEEYEVYGLSLHEEKSKVVKDVIHYHADLREYGKIGTILDGIKPDFIIHLAARTEVENSFYEQVTFSEINYCGTVNLIEKAREFCPDLKLFLFASTMETYGWQPEENWKPFTEETPQNPNAPYSVAKVGCEKYLEYAGRAYSLPWSAIRTTNTYGRWDNDFFVVEQFITQMLKNDKEVNFGYKEPYRNFLWIHDLLDLYLTMIKKYENAKSNIFCTGPDNAIKIEDLAHLIAKKLNWKGKINWNRKRERAGEIFYLNSTHEKVKRILGWEPNMELSEGLDKTIEIWKNNLEKK